MTLLLYAGSLTPVIVLIPLYMIVKKNARGFEAKIEFFFTKCSFTHFFRKMANFTQAFARSYVVHISNLYESAVN